MLPRQHIKMFVQRWNIYNIFLTLIMSFNLRGKVHDVLPSESWDSGQQQLWWQTDRADGWHTFGCGKSLLCWRRARFSPSCSKCELMLYAFHSEGETRNRSPEELRRVCSKEESRRVCGVCLSEPMWVYVVMYIHILFAHFRDNANPSE